MKLIISGINLSEDQNILLRSYTRLLSVEATKISFSHDPKMANVIVFDNSDSSKDTELTRTFSKKAVLIFLSNDYTEQPNMLTKPLSWPKFKGLMLRLIDDYTSFKQQNIDSYEPDTKAINQYKFNNNQICFWENISDEIIEKRREPELFIDLEKNLVFSKIDKKEIIQWLSKEKLNYQRIKEISSLTPEVTQSWHKLSLNDLVMPSAIARSQGKLIEGLSLDKPFLIKKWPSFSWIYNSDKLFDVCALLTINSLSINDISKKLTINEELLIGFTNGCALLGCLELKKPSYLNNNRKPLKSHNLTPESKNDLKGFLQKFKNKLSFWR